MERNVSFGKHYDDFYNSMDAGSVLVTGGGDAGDEPFEEIQGSSEGEASMIPEDETNSPDDTAAPVE